MISKVAFTHDDRFANRYANTVRRPVCKLMQISGRKRLNKSDLIKIGQNSNLETYKCTKVELINKLVDAGLCESPLSSGAGGAVGGDCSDTDTLLPVDLQCDFLYYERLAKVARWLTGRAIHVIRYMDYG